VQVSFFSGAFLAPIFLNI